MKKTLSGIASIILVAVLLDLMILFAGLAQIAVEGRTGEWNGFWRPQAEFVISLLK